LLIAYERNSFELPLSNLFSPPLVNKNADDVVHSCIVDFNGDGRRLQAPSGV
jgi:hypothetical protein